MGKDGKKSKWPSGVISSLSTPYGRQKAADGLYEWLVQPVHASTLGVFRFLYGLVMCAQIFKWWLIFVRFEGTLYSLPYPGVGFVKPLHPTTGNIVLCICLIASLFVALGYFTRPSTCITFLTFAYLFHMCESLHNNHYILMCHVNFVGSFLNWGEWCSIDSMRKKNDSQNKVAKIPYWNLLLMQLLFTIPYLYGSFAKLNSDWLFRAEPVRMWMVHKEGWVLHQWWFPWFICWSGTLFDMTISFLLFWKKTRFLLAFPGAIMFNVSNKLIFNIGVFPYAMICSLVLFLDDDTPAIFWNSLKGMPPPIIPISKSDDPDNKKDMRKPSGWRGKVYKRFVLIFFSGFVIFHSLYPLRHFVLYKSNPSWTEEGHVGAWHMKLRSKHSWLYLTAEEMDGTETVLMPDYDPLLLRLQLKIVTAHPHALLLYVRRLNQVFEEAKRPLKTLKVKSCASLNANPAQELYIDSANLLDYMNNYERIGVTGIGKFLYGQKEAPLCDHLPNPYTREGKANTKAAFKQLYADANFFQTLIRDDSMGRSYQRLLHRSVDPKTGREKLEYGFVWNT
ncbi:hypothetical protein BSKO_04291 [Bryopsis sp. KO-2023]|nr:hypothetical protein BSKO_04291 [Bryopsis sp. KO-2023]